MAEDDHRVRAATVLFGEEDTPLLRARPEHREDFLADGHDGDALGSVVGGLGLVVPEDAAGGFEDVETAVGVGGVVLGGAAGKVVPGELVPDHDEAAGVGVGERAQEEGVHHAEDGGIRADAEGEGQHGGDGEAGGAEETSNRVSKVVPHG
jgi:hypothetical protein